MLLSMRSLVLAVLCLLALAAVSVRADMCHGKPSPNAQPNLFPISNPAPVFVRSTDNAALYTLQVHDQDIKVLHLWGTPYQKGFAQGTLMKNELSSFITQVYAYVINEAAVELNKSLHIPMSEAIPLATDAINLGLDQTAADTAPFTGAWYGEELQGLADATGMDYNYIRNVQMLGELTKGSCSMFGTWDEALAGGDGLLTMRALDWITDGPFQEFHQLSVYHADTSVNSTERTFVTMGWTGWIGSITGVNDAQLSIHEIGVYFPDDSFGAMSTKGVPFTYVLRDILQFDGTRMDGVSRLATASRTCDLILGVGDGKDKRFNSVGYSASLCMIMDDTNQKPVADWHPTVPSTVYHAMDWLCPGFNSVMADQLTALWGKLTPALAIQQVLPIVQTGSLHAYVADLPNMQWYVSFAASANSTDTAKLAYDRQFAQIDLRTMFAVKPTEISSEE